ncbi:hypothetical protein T484DRAFT_1821939 [Baffinella frigidus]|nr:hypothetical protein T484DRAFT_1821939 [Cryptophyta sp. CCMP2293]
MASGFCSCSSSTVGRFCEMCAPGRHGGGGAGCDQVFEEPGIKCHGHGLPDVLGRCDCAPAWCVSWD